jgi:GntR family transcriptional regulator
VNYARGKYTPTAEGCKQEYGFMQVFPGLIPRYYQLKKILEERIESGEFQPGDQFSTDDELCAEYNLSRGTVRRAVDMLVDEGRLRREQGRGTFVTAPQLSPVYFRLAAFGEEMHQRGLEPGTQLLRLRTFPANEEIATQLRISVGEKTIEIDRLRLANGKPMAIETRYIPYHICPQLLEEDLESQSIHNLLIEKFNIPLIRACHTIEARVLSGQEAETLQVKPGSAGFLIDRVTYTTGNQPVSWYRTIYRGDQYRFIAEFQQLPQSP